MKQKKLIISFDTYSWIEKCSGLILNSPKSFEIMIVCSDDTKPIYTCKDLCPQAIYEQRKEDLYNIGKELGIPKISNLLCDECRIDPLQLAIQIQLPLAVGSITSVYYQDNEYLNAIFKKMVNIDAKKYKEYDTEDYFFKYSLSEEQIKTKRRVLNLMVGSPKESYPFIKEEKFYKV